MKNNDNELFELCKEVYEKTHWETGKAFFDDESDNKLLVPVAIKYGAVAMLNVPLYTSDYLLEKLQFQMVKYELKYSFFKQRWELNGKPRYGGGRVIGDTPLEALLNLVIVLDDSGELNNE